MNFEVCSFSSQYKSGGNKTVGRPMLLGGMKKVVAHHNTVLPSYNSWNGFSCVRGIYLFKNKNLWFTRKRPSLVNLRHGCMIWAGQVPATDHKTLYNTRDIPIERFGYLSDFEKKYEIGDMIGSGTFGKVCMSESQPLTCCSSQERIWGAISLCAVWHYSYQAKILSLSGI
jgi:hypothetical protein